MIWRSTAMLVVAFVAAGYVVWYAPMLMDWIGLSEFALVGQLGLPILLLSVLELLFRRISGPTGPGFIRYDMV